MVDERSLVLFEGADDALESRGNVCEVGDTTTNDENLALRVRGATGHQIDWKNVRFSFPEERIQDVPTVFAYS